MCQIIYLSCTLSKCPIRLKKSRIFKTPLTFRHFMHLGPCLRFSRRVHFNLLTILWTCVNDPVYWIKFHEELDIDVIANLFLARTGARVVKMYVHPCICVCDNLPKKIHLKLFRVIWDAVFRHFSQIFANFANFYKCLHFSGAKNIFFPKVTQIWSSTRKKNKK